jgi:hypothetical protein
LGRFHTTTSFPLTALALPAINSKLPGVVAKSAERYPLITGPVLSLLASRVNVPTGEDEAETIAEMLTCPALWTGHGSLVKVAPSDSSEAKR